MKDEGGWQLLVDMWGSRWLVTGAGVRYPLRRESIAPSLLPAFSGSGHDDPWSVPDDNLLERAIAHAHIWAAEQATRQHNADLEPPF
jgi:hypothetical protein